MIKNIKRTILLLLIIFSSLKVDAKKMDFPLVVMAGNADIIVIGEIYGIKNNSYTFKITETLKGQVYKIISVKLFNEWTCDVRFDKPKIGQKLCLFLRKKKNFSWEVIYGNGGELKFRKYFSNWEIINGSTGELQISDDLIYLGGEDSLTFVNNEITYNSVSLSQFKRGIRDFCKCYQFIGEFDYFSTKPQYFLQTCSDLQISNFRNRSKFSEWLFKRMERFSIEKIMFIDYNSVFKPNYSFMFL
jgi:hypothetical protein